MELKISDCKPPFNVTWMSVVFCLCLLEFVACFTFGNVRSEFTLSGCLLRALEKTEPTPQYFSHNSRKHELVQSLATSDASRAL